MKGKLIIIEGVDGSGKETQAVQLVKRLKNEDYPVKKVGFPDYESDSSALIKMYLKGEFGNNPDDVNPYAASTFYAVDRYASYKTKWGNFYEDGGIVVADRYTSSNMIHQGAKIIDNNKKSEYLRWLIDFEFKLFGLPEPDCVVFLDMPPDFREKLIKERNNKITGSKEKDIHEKDIEYMNLSHRNACFIADTFGWNIIHCVENGKLKSIPEIHEEIYSLVIKSL